jgi:formylglycine-generating enzyme required for sulfatase activity
MVVGTPAYLSPEQITGGNADARSDIYALGIMAYEMLAGRPPFEGPTPTAVLMKRLAEKPTPVEKLRPDVPPVLRDVIEGCLAQDPRDRFSGAGEIVRALGGATPSSGGHSTVEIVARVRRARRRWSIIVGAGAALAALLVGFAFWRLWSQRAPAAAAAALPEGLVVVPSGTFLIGRDDGQPFARPAHPVTLDSFAMEPTEVTVAEYRRFMDAANAPAPWRGEPSDSLLPVTGLNWGEAAAYCAWRYPGGRLPVEEEWEAAARGAEGRRLPWGNAAEPGRANTASRRAGGPVAVRSFPSGATPEGLFDMVGNVWEWTGSTMEAYPGGTAPPDGARYRVIRGGAFNSLDSIATPSWRGYLLPAAPDRASYSATGLRCVVPLRRP